MDWGPILHGCAKTPGFGICYHCEARCTGLYGEGPAEAGNAEGASSARKRSGNRTADLRILLGVLSRALESGNAVRGIAHRRGAALLASDLSGRRTEGRQDVATTTAAVYFCLGTFWR